MEGNRNDDNQLRKSITIPVAAVWLLLLTLAEVIAQPALPVGTHPPPIKYEHFPNPVYAVVWRNWNLVEPARIAKTIGCDVKDVHEIASSMGLPPPKTIPPRYKKQIYITVLRRNWHLLPYDQLLTLVDMTERELEFSLKEDDFLWHKFGYLKPDCPRVAYSRPDAKTRARATEIRHLVERHFNAALKKPSEPLFSFIEALSSTGADMNKKLRKETPDALRFIYSYFGVFGDPLIDAASNPYPDGLLEKLAASGVNGIWMHVVLNQLAPGGADFPEFGEGHEQRLVNLRRIVAQAKQFGIKVYLYMNEPRAQTPSFFQQRPEMAGVTVNDFVTMCTSDVRVRRWITHSLTHVFKEVPDLGGVFTITASENLTSCVSHGRQQECPRCSKRSYADIIAEVNAAIEEGVHGGNPDAKVIVWDWGWHGNGDATETIEKLPRNVWFMSVSEWALPIERGGVTSAVGEYSISSVGPGPRARRHWAVAKAAGLKTVAKVQFNNTWELSAIPWIPALDLVAEHAGNLAKAGVDGLMLSWTLGGYPSPNLEIAQRFSENPDAEANDVLNAVAVQRYGVTAAPFARKAWTAFSNAFRHFPYHQKVVYSAPQQYGPSNLLYEKPTGYAATMVGFPYDDVDGWRGPYPRDVFISQFAKVADGWKEGLGYFNQVISSCDDDRRQIAVSDFRIAKAAYLHFASVANQGRYVVALDALQRSDLAVDEKRSRSAEIESILLDEIRIAKELFAITRDDSRIGFEASNQYYYVGQDLMEKVLNCEYLRERFRTR